MTPGHCPCVRSVFERFFSIGFDVVDRYRKLLHFYRKVGFDHEDRWVSDRLKRILGDEDGNELSAWQDERKQI